MGYELHITRKNRWSAEGSDIPDGDWRAYVASDPEMSMSGVAEAALPDGTVLRYDSALMAEWRVHPDGGIVWFDFRRGQIVVKNPDEQTIAKMRRIAAALHGRVQGDEGQFYDG